MKYFKNEMQAEDATMQIFEKLITDLKKHHIASFRPWLHTVVKNHCMMQFRKESNEEKKMADMRREASIPVVENPDENHLSVVNDREFVLQYLKEGIDELKDEQRVCIELFYIKNVSYSEISTITGYGLKEVKSYIQNGKRNLRNYITAKNEQSQEGKA
jgi:RNA polymerase sigma-70 factor (ECF subfamily)